MGRSLTEFEQKALEKLSQIVEKLELILDLSVPPLNIEGIALGEVEEKVLELCNMKNDTDDIATKLGKKRHHIEVTLHNLRKKGLIRPVKVGSKTYYVRTSVQDRGAKRSGQ